MGCVRLDWVKFGWVELGLVRLGLVGLGYQIQTSVSEILNIGTSADSSRNHFSQIAHILIYQIISEYNFFVVITFP